MPVGGVLVAAVVLAAAQPLRRTPEELGLQPDGASDAPAASDKAAAEAPPTEGHTVRQALATRAFWVLGASQALLTFVASAISVHLIPYTVSKLRLPLEGSGALVTALLAGAVAGQLIGGYVGDRVDKRWAIVVLVAAQIGTLALLAFGGSLAMVLLFAVLQGLLFGVRSPLLVAIRADYFGRRAYGTIWGVSLLVMNVGGMAGMVVTGLLADHFGGYRVAFFVMMAMTVVAMVLVAAARAPRRVAERTA
jgi:MFS family permease